MATVPAMTRANMIGALKTLGWNPRTPAEVDRALRDFQRGFALPGLPALTIDGKNGPRTRVAIRAALARQKAGKPTASRWFSFAEFRCNCGGRYPDCARIRVHRDLLLGLDELRDITGPIAIVSGYRCPAHNQKQGGATLSQHPLGSAADVIPKKRTADVTRLRRFSGIGFQARTGLVRHVDVRHVSGNNTTGGTPAVPTTWRYP